MAALSVQKRGGGMCTWMPCSPAAAASAARSGPLAATPPVRTTRLTPTCSAARTVRRTSIFTTAAWNEAATSATCASLSGPRRCRVVERRVAAGDDQRQEGMLGRIVGEERGVDVPLEMIHADQRQIVHPGQRLGHRAADQQRADQPRALRHRDAVEIAQLDA